MSINTKFTASCEAVRIPKNTFVGYDDLLDVVKFLTAGPIKEVNITVGAEGQRMIEWKDVYQQQHGLFIGTSNVEILILRNGQLIYRHEHSKDNNKGWGMPK